VGLDESDMVPVEMSVLALKRNNKEFVAKCQWLWVKTVSRTGACNLSLLAHQNNTQGKAETGSRGDAYAPTRSRERYWIASLM